MKIHVVEISSVIVPPAVKSGGIQIILSSAHLKPSPLRLFGLSWRQCPRPACAGNPILAGLVPSAFRRATTTELALRFHRMAGRGRDMFAMRHIAASTTPSQKRRVFSLAREIAPALIQIAFIHNLVKNDWFAPCFEPFFRRFEFRKSADSHGSPMAGRSRTSLSSSAPSADARTDRVAPQCEKTGRSPAPFLHASDRTRSPSTPDVAVSRQACENVTQISVIGFGGMVAYSQRSLGMEQDQIRFDAQSAKGLRSVCSRWEKKAGLGREKLLIPSALRSNG